MMMPPTPDDGPVAPADADRRCVAIDPYLLALAAAPAAPSAAHRSAENGVDEPDGAGAYTRMPRNGGDGGGADGGGTAAAAQAADPICANCLHGKDHHTAKSEEGLMCDVAIAVSYSDPADGCPCERYIPQGTACSVDGCGRDAVHYRVGQDGRAYDMCVAHFEEAEPYGPRYYDLTGGRGACSVDGCARDAVRYRVDENGDGGHVCAEHFEGAEPDGPSSPAVAESEDGGAVDDAGTGADSGGGGGNGGEGEGGGGE